MALVRLNAWGSVQVAWLLIVTYEMTSRMGLSTPLLYATWFFCGIAIGGMTNCFDMTMKEKSDNGLR